MSDALLNLDGVQFDRIRKVIDPKFRALADELDVAYYSHWKHGLSYDFYGRDPITSGADPKVVFDRLSALIWNKHEEALLAANAGLAEPYPEDKINPIETDGRRKSEIIAENISALEAIGFEFDNRLKRRV